MCKLSPIITFGSSLPFPIRYWKYRVISAPIQLPTGTETPFPIIRYASLVMAPCLDKFLMRSGLVIFPSFLQNSYRTLYSRIRPVFLNLYNMRERKKPYSVPDELRSRIMRSNKSHGNLSTELTLARLMRANRISGWRRRVLMTGRPDFVFKQQRVALFIDGCYWHGCKCRRLPKKNREYWKEKFRDNQARDKRTTRDLRMGGWRVIRIWEHQLKDTPNSVVKRIAQILNRLPSPDGDL